MKFLYKKTTALAIFFSLLLNLGIVNAEETKKNLIPGKLSLNYSINKESSGTSWLPNSSPLYTSVFKTNEWVFTTGGNILPRINLQNILNSTQNKRGGYNIDVPTWLMFTAQNQVHEGGQVSLVSKFSFDYLTMLGNGYFQLFQTGETFEGKYLSDRQHSRDLLTEISLNYSYSLNSENSIFAYFGYPGNPAIAVPLYSQRISSLNNPFAPLSSHLINSAHTSYGVGTLGWIYNGLKIDASIFNGSEPDENKFNLDGPKFNSYSGRLTLNPIDDLSIQTSYAYITGSDSLRTNINNHKINASILHNKNFSSSMNIATSLIYGINIPNELQNNFISNSFLVESELEYYKNYFYTRTELVQKDSSLLNLNLEKTRLINVFAVTLGYSRNLLNIFGLNLNLGGNVTLHVIENDLQKQYGNIPVSTQLYIKIFPEKLFNL